MDNAELVQSSAPGRSTRSWIELVTAVVGLIAAIVALVFGLVAQKQKQDAQAQTTSAQRQVDDSQARVQDLESRLAAAKKKNEELQAQIDGASAAGAQIQDQAIYHKGVVTVAVGGLVDLDAPINDPQWGMLTKRGTDLLGVDRTVRISALETARETFRYTID
jgi:uncharacterized protein YlxW (UPF0749 family)